MTQAAPLSFPPVLPEGYPALASEPEFDPAKHLALEKPETVISLEELGYEADEIAQCPTSLGITSCFRVLSDEGVACLQEVTRGLEQYARSIPRISRMVRGAPISPDSCAICVCRQTSRYWFRKSAVRACWPTRSRTNSAI